MCPGSDVAAARRPESRCRCGSGEFVSAVAAPTRHGRSARRSYYDVGVCVLGKRCGYAHGQDELRADPDIGNGTHACIGAWLATELRPPRGDSGS